MMSAHTKRVVTGIILFCVVSALFLAGGWPLKIFAGAVAVLGMWEFCAMFGLKDQPLAKLYSALPALVVFCCVAVHPDWLAVALLSAFWLVAMSYLVVYSKNQEASFTLYMMVLTGVVYIAVPLGLAAHFSVKELFFVILLAVANDAGAFYGGKFFGKHKIWPVISPKKTWEGAFFGLMATALVATVFGLSVGQMSAFCFFITGAAAAIVAQLGDFFESALKRKQDIKDSGAILPGHGGILDRIDALLFVVYFYAGCSLFYQYFPVAGA